MEGIEGGDIRDGGWERAAYMRARLVGKPVGRTTRQWRKEDRTWLGRTDATRGEGSV